MYWPLYFVNIKLISPFNIANHYFAFIKYYRYVYITAIVFHSTVILNNDMARFCISGI